MLLNITMAAHPIAAAVTAIVTVGQCCRRKSLAGMQPYVSLSQRVLGILTKSTAINHDGLAGHSIHSAISDHHLGNVISTYGSD